MTQKIALLQLTAVATAVLTAERFIGANGTVATAAGNALGVTCTDAKIGDHVGYDALGTTIVTASAPIVKDALLEVAAGGKAVTKTTGVAVARALQAAGADGDRIEVVLIPN